MKLLYSLLVVDNHWFATYHIYYKEKLAMEKLIYNSYLLYKSGLFGIMGIQTDDTLILANNNFANKEKAKIKVAKIIIID